MHLSMVGFLLSPSESDVLAKNKIVIFDKTCKFFYYLGP